MLRLLVDEIKISRQLDGQIFIMFSNEETVKKIYEVSCADRNQIRTIVLSQFEKY